MILDGKDHIFITAEKGGVARAKGVREKEKECSTTECKSQRRLGDGPGHLITGAGRSRSREMEEERRR